MTNKELKVIHFYTGNRFGGIERFLQNLNTFSHFYSNTKQEFALTFEGKLKTELEKSGAKVHFFKVNSLSNLFQVFIFLFSFLSFLRRSKVDLLISHEIWNYLLAFLPAKFMGIKHVLWVHTSYFHQRNYKLLDISQPDFIVSNSEYVKSKLKERFGLDQVEVLYCPHPMMDAPEHKTADRDNFKMLYVGRFLEDKGLFVILKAVSKLKDLNFQFLIVGAPQTAKEKEFFVILDRFVKESGLTNHVIFVGASDTVSDYYKTSHLFCHPNIAPDGFGLVFIEALSAGIPVITTKMGGAIEIFSRSHSNIGEFVEPNNEQDLSNVLRKYIEAKNVIFDPEEARRVAKSFCEPEEATKKIETTLLKFKNS